MTFSKSFAFLFRLMLFVMMAAAVIIVAVVALGRAMFARNEGAEGGEEEAVKSL